jgi:hypothetical protein
LGANDCRHLATSGHSYGSLRRSRRGHPQQQQRGRARLRAPRPATPRQHADPASHARQLNGRTGSLRHGQGRPRGLMGRTERRALAQRSPVPAGAQVPACQVRCGLVAAVGVGISMLAARMRPSSERHQVDCGAGLAAGADQLVGVPVGDDRGAAATAATARAVVILMSRSVIAAPRGARSRAGSVPPALSCRWSCDRPLEAPRTRQLRPSRRGPAPDRRGRSYGSSRRACGANVSGRAGPGALPGSALQPTFRAPLLGPPFGQARQHLGVLDPHRLQRPGVESEQRQDRRSNLNGPHLGADGRAVPQAGQDH